MGRIRVPCRWCLAIIRGLTNTLPLHVEVSYNDYDVIGAFAGASILAGLAIVTLVLKVF